MSNLLVLNSVTLDTLAKQRTHTCKQSHVFLQH